MSNSRNRELKSKSVILGSSASSCATLFRGYIISGSKNKLKVTAPDNSVTEYAGSSFTIADDEEIEGKVNIIIHK
jgi:hypothetical protein